MNKPKWGVYSFANGLQLPNEKTLEELACKSKDDLLHVITVLLNNGSEEAVGKAEELFDAHA